MLGIAELLARRATCRKLAVGCVLVDVRGRIVGTGYNGVPRGMAHCTDMPCPGAGAERGSDTCIAVHAEQNALMRCANVEDIHACYTTHAPCLRCTKMLLNTGCETIMFVNGELVEPAAEQLWIQAKGFGLWAHYRDFRARTG